MTVAAKTSFGVQLKLAAAPTSPTAIIAELLSLKPPSIARELIDVTTHDSVGGAEEMIPEGTYAPGVMSGQIHYIAGSTTDTLMRGAALANTLMNFIVVVKGAAGNFNQSGQCYVTSYDVDDLPVKGKQSVSFTLQIVGAVTQAAAA